MIFNFSIIGDLLTFSRSKECFCKLFSFALQTKVTLWSILWVLFEIAWYMHGIISSSRRRTHSQNYFLGFLQISLISMWNPSYYYLRVIVNFILTGYRPFISLFEHQQRVKDLRALVLREDGKGGSCSIKLTCIWIYREHQLQSCEARIYHEVLDLYVIPFISVDKRNYNSNSSKKLMDLVTSVFLFCIFDDIFSLFCCLCFLFFGFQPTFFPLDLFSLFFLHWLILFCFLGFFFILLW